MKPRILIVDDSLTVRMDLGEALQSAGFDTVLCADIGSAREALAHERAALIVIDILLSDGSGLDFLQVLRRSPTTAEVPVLLLSTEEEVKNRVQTMDVGAVVFIGKPYNLAELVAQVQALTQVNDCDEAAIYAGSDPSLLGAKRLLAVDDSNTYIQELASQLREEDYVVILASSGEEALELLATEPVDGILLDLVMPGLSGQEVCKRIKQRAKWRDIPLIMLTAHDDRDAMIECINAGADDYIAKSADFEVLKVRLRAHLRRKHFEDENHRIREKLVRSETEATSRIQMDAEREKLDQRLRDHQFYTRSLFESNIDALMTTDPSGIITDVNHQMEALTECTRDELIGAPFSRYFTDPERAEASIKLVLIKKKLTNYELTVRARGGKETVVSFNTTTFYDRYRNLQGVFSAARDITERKLFDQVLLQKNAELESAKSAAEKANLAKSDFLSRMSHELRTPLNAILGFTQLIESGTPLPTPEQQQNLEEVLKAGWYLLELINEILDLAQIESGNITVLMEPVSLLDVMLECGAMIEPQAEKRGICMTFPHFELPGYFVHADQTRIKQALINLLINAIKYNTPGGTVAVECTLLPSNFIRIGVRDTGQGLAPEKFAQLFQPFNRLGKESGSEEGTGIGLVVTKRLIELMGGTIGAESTVGVGSVFWIELSLTNAPLPAVREAGHAALMRPEVPEETAVRTLLYVEDNPANLELVEQFIARRPDLRLITATDSHLGIEFARIYQPEVILMDINMPGISGIEAMKILRADPSTAHIPIIAISANALPQDVEKAIQAGFFKYITKPFKVIEFMETLDVALRLPRTASGPARLGLGHRHHLHP
jgi:PAS domain S-box-containing protein